MTNGARGLHRAILAVLSAVVLMLMPGCMEPEPDAGQELLLTLDEVEAVLKEEGLELTRVWVRFPVIEDILIRPTAYAIGEPDKYLFVYEFERLPRAGSTFPLVPVVYPNMMGTPCISRLRSKT